MSFKDIISFITGDVSASWAVRKRLVPKQDITTYELAYIVSHCNGNFYPSQEVRFTQEKWDSLEPQYKRHFEDK